MSRESKDVLALFQCFLRPAPQIAAGYLLAPLPRVVAFRNNAFLPRSGQLLVS
ncbi:hypothetical protein JMJ77_0007326, partial [Colletotrichum scovillei]